MVANGATTEESRYYTEAEMAEILGIAIGTLRKNRSIGRKHPPFIKLGGAVLFPKEEFKMWFQKLPIKREVSGGR